MYHIPVPFCRLLLLHTNHASLILNSGPVPLFSLSTGPDCVVPQSNQPERLMLNEAAAFFKHHGNRSTAGTRPPPWRAGNKTCAPLPLHRDSPSSGLLREQRRGLMEKVGPRGRKKRAGAATFPCDAARWWFLTPGDCDLRPGRCETVLLLQDTSPSQIHSVNL